MYAAAQRDTVRRPDGYITTICARTVSRVFQHQQECSPEPAGPQDRVIFTDLRFNQRESSFIPHLTASHRCSLEASPRTVRPALPAGKMALRAVFVVACLCLSLTARGAKHSFTAGDKVTLWANKGGAGLREGWCPEVARL